VDLTGLDDAFRAATVAGFDHALAAGQLLSTEMLAEAPRSAPALAQRPASGQLSEVLCQ
jgi:hypothetical protein